MLEDDRDDCSVLRVRCLDRGLAKVLVSERIDERVRGERWPGFHRAELVAQASAEIPLFPAGIMAVM
jgi:hypothetical protein